jgi:methylated-DNA-[protein]-cysteine S-methyltransferase
MVDTFYGKDRIGIGNPRCFSASASISRSGRSGRLSTEMSSDLVWTIYESPLGPLTVLAGPLGIRGVHFPGRSPRLEETARRPLAAAVDQLDAYFAGERQAFELDLDLRGAPLQKLVWAQLREIPYGATTTYGELAGRIEESAYPSGLEPYKRVRLTAAAIGRTPTPILVPCHRVIGADGSLTGYGGGLQRKQALLDLESRGAAGRSPEPSWAARQLPML